MAYTLTTSKTWHQTVQDLAATFEKWGITEWTTDPLRVDSRKSWWMPSERKVTVTFKHRGQEAQSFSMDKQDRPVDNLRALYLGLEAMRMNEVRGIGDLVREMYAALPAPKVEKTPYEVLGIGEGTSIDVIKLVFRTKAKALHPDTGGETADPEAMKELQEAYERLVGAQ